MRKIIMGLMLFSSACVSYAPIDTCHLVVGNSSYDAPTCVMADNQIGYDNDGRSILTYFNTTKQISSGATVYIQAEDIDVSVAVCSSGWYGTAILNTGDEGSWVLALDLVCNDNGVRVEIKPVITQDPTE